MLNRLPQELQFLLIALAIVGVLLLVALIRILLLARANRRMRSECVKMEKQAHAQQIEVTAIHHDSMSWRAKTQRQFEALRAELSHHLLQAGQRSRHAQRLLDTAHEQSLAAAQVKIQELESRLTCAAAATPNPEFSSPRPRTFAKPAESGLPSLPAMETLRIQALEAELAAAKAEITASRQQTAALQRHLLLLP